MNSGLNIFGLPTISPIISDQPSLMFELLPFESPNRKYIVFLLSNI